ncbi:MAG: substrate-binding domain-containing protein [Paracoccaceae bacterium]
MSVVNSSAASIVVTALLCTPAIARDQVNVAGSSTVLPYASIVAEAFGENTDFPTPVVESGGSSAGLKRFCEGVGAATIDIANASRQMKQSELEICAENGVTDVIEVRIGYDGIVFASELGGHSFEFTPADWFLALSDQIVVDGAIVPNPNDSWAQVNPTFPDQDIAAFVPGTKHGTREVFEDKVILVGCQETGAYDVFLAAATGASDADKEHAAEKACIDLRTDGVSVDIDGDYTETLASINANSDGIGVFGLSFYENNTDQLQVALMSGIEPSIDTIASGEYPVSRPLYFYLKKAHIGVIPGLKEFAGFFISDDLAGEDGLLSEFGLVADPDLIDTQDAVENETTLESGA